MRHIKYFYTDYQQSIHISLKAKKWMRKELYSEGRSSKSYQKSVERLTVGKGSKMIRNVL